MSLPGVVNGDFGDIDTNVIGKAAIRQQPWQKAVSAAELHQRSTVAQLRHQPEDNRTPLSVEPFAATILLFPNGFIGADAPQYAPKAGMSCDSQVQTEQFSLEAIPAAARFSYPDSGSLLRRHSAVETHLILRRICVREDPTGVGNRVGGKCGPVSEIGRTLDSIRGPEHSIID